MVFGRGLLILLILNSALLAQKNESRTNVPYAAFEDLHHNLLEVKSHLIHLILNGVSDTAFEEHLHQNLLKLERGVKNFAMQVEEEKMQVEKRYLELQTAFVEALRHCVLNEC
jgi:hypothetical protein